MNSPPPSNPNLESLLAQMLLDTAVYISEACRSPACLYNRTTHAYIPRVYRYEVLEWALGMRIAMMKDIYTQKHAEGKAE